MLLLAGILGLLGALTGCGPRSTLNGHAGAGSAGVPAGSSSGSIVSSGRTRTYRLYRPASLPAGAAVGHSSRPIPASEILRGGPPLPVVK